MMIAIVGIFGQRSDSDEDEIIGAEIDAAFDAVFDPGNPGRLLAAGLDVEIDVGDLDAVAKSHTAILQPFDQRQDHRFILVVAVELERGKIRQTADMVDEAMQIELHLERGMPFLEGEHGAPVEPEVAPEEIIAEDFVDPLVLHLLPRREEDGDQISSRAIAECQQSLVGHILALVLRDALQRNSDRPC